MLSLIARNATRQIASGTPLFPVLSCRSIFQSTFDVRKMEKCIITVAPTGSLPKKKQTPYVPVTPQEIIETAIQCEKAGAALIHVHARDLIDESASADYGFFEEAVNGIREKTNLVINISTGGRAGYALEARSERLKLKCEMASLTTGSINFTNEIYENSPHLIQSLAAECQKYGTKPEMEIFDTSMIQPALDLVKKGLATPPLHFDFVLGLKGCMPAAPENLLMAKGMIPEDATWAAVGVGFAQLPVNAMTIMLGGHPRVGLEDNIFWDSKKTLCSNEQLVGRVADMIKLFGREVATPDEARKILCL